jgi:hypothetical protein
LPMCFKNGKNTKYGCL